MFLWPKSDNDGNCVLTFKEHFHTPAKFKSSWQQSVWKTVLWKFLPHTRRKTISLWPRPPPLIRGYAAVSRAVWSRGAHRKMWCNMTLQQPEPPRGGLEVGVSGGWVGVGGRGHCSILSPLFFLWLRQDWSLGGWRWRRWREQQQLQRGEVEVSFLREQLDRVWQRRSALSERRAAVWQSQIIII